MIRRYLRPELALLCFGLTMKLLGSVAELVIPMLLADMLDEVVPTGNRRAIWLQGGLMLLFALLALVGNIVANQNSARVSSRVTRRIRHDLFTRTLHLSQHQVDRIGIPSLETRLTSDTYHVHQMISRLQRLGVRAPILLLGGLAFTVALDPVLALSLIVLLPFMGIAIYLIARRGRPLYNQLQANVDLLTRRVRETVTGIRIIRALVTERSERARFAGVNQTVSASERRAAYNMALTNPLMTLLLNIGLALVLLIGAWRINRGLMEFGVIIAFLTYFTIITSSMIAVTRIFAIYNRGISSAERIEEILTLPDEDENMPGSSAVAEGDACTPAAIEFRDVSFSYDGKHDQLEEISFRLEAGQTLGIIGPTGSGKSTLLLLLLGLYPDYRGEIYLDGRENRSWTRRERAELFGVTFQNDFLYRDSIRQNVGFARQVAEEDIVRAVADARASDFVAEKSGGLDFELGVRAANLSGGQRQRLLIARALATRPRILILDDASSALDYRTDAELRQALREHYAGATSVIVAQRISSIQHADLILLIENGRIAASGSHAELLVNSPAYREIAASQMGVGVAAPQMGAAGGTS
ncbi:MAG: ABC transporter ATP-binding protein [Bacillota bacterium]|nr:ABC transporter ATP-binding protein [Bacillota bacterium]